MTSAMMISDAERLRRLSASSGMVDAPRDALNAKRASAYEYGESISVVIPQRGAVKHGCTMRGEGLLDAAGDQGSN